jgi:hypothetical protein
MSAFIVLPCVIDKIVSRIAKSYPNSIGRHDPVGSVVRAVICNPRLDPSWEDGRAALQQLGQDMLALNERAVGCRYPDHEAGPPREYHWTERHGTADIVALKALDCWLYQCSEGDCPSDPLYQTMTKLSREMARAILRESPEYQAAAWGEWIDRQDQVTVKVAK